MPSKKLDFKTGQYVVYPTQGVGKLVRVEEQNIGGQKIKMLVIDFERNHMTLRVPVERAEISGLRPLTSMKKMDEAISAAKGKAGAKRMIWARRAAPYEENINSGDPMKLAEVVRDLQRRNATDTMTFSARQLYLRALERMAQEFAVLPSCPSCKSGNFPPLPCQYHNSFVIFPDRLGLQHKPHHFHPVLHMPLSVRRPFRPKKNPERKRTPSGPCRKPRFLPPCRPCFPGPDIPDNPRFSPLPKTASSNLFPSS